VCMFVCLCLFLYVYIYRAPASDTHSAVCMCTYMCVYVCLSLFIHIYIYRAPASDTHSALCTCTYMCVCLSVSDYSCIYILYIHIGHQRGTHTLLSARACICVCMFVCLCFFLWPPVSPKIPEGGHWGPKGVRFSNVYRLCLQAMFTGYVPMFQCSKVPMFQCSKVPMSNVPMFQCSKCLQAMLAPIGSFQNQHREAGELENCQLGPKTISTAAWALLFRHLCAGSDNPLHQTTWCLVVWSSCNKQTRLQKKWSGTVKWLVIQLQTRVLFFNRKTPN